jgi:hypothetical protein
VRRVKLTWRQPRTERRGEQTIEIHGQPGQGCLVVIKTDDPYRYRAAVSALQRERKTDPPLPCPGGTPIVWLPEGSEFEIWEET